MTKEKKIIVVMAIISILVIAILSYFLINKNAIIEKQAEKIELQAMETNGSNSYTTTEDHLKEIAKNYFVEEMNMGSGGGTTCHIIYDISNCNFSTISFQTRRGASVPNSPSIYFSIDGTTYTKISTMTDGAKYEYVDRVFNIPNNCVKVKLEWEIGSDRAWFHNIKFN